MVGGSIQVSNLDELGDLKRNPDRPKEADVDEDCENPVLKVLYRLSHYFFSIGRHDFLSKHYL